MATSLAKAGLFEPRVGRRVRPRPVIFHDSELDTTNSTTLPMRGIIFGVLISVPLWALIGIAIYLLV